MLSLRRTLAKFNSPISGKIEVVQAGQERRLMVGGLAQSINYDAPDVNGRIWEKLTEIENCLILVDLYCGSKYPAKAESPHILRPL